MHACVQPQPLSRHHQVTSSRRMHLHLGCFFPVHCLVVQEHCLVGLYASNLKICAAVEGGFIFEAREDPQHGAKHAAGGCWCMGECCRYGAVVELPSC